MSNERTYQPQNKAQLISAQQHFNHYIKEISPFGLKTKVFNFKQTLTLEQNCGCLSIKKIICFFNSKVIMGCAKYVQKLFIKLM